MSASDNGRLDALPEDRTKDRLLVRQTAALLYAADMMWFREQPTAEAQLAWCRTALDAGDAGEWANGSHSGDCTKRAHACARCLMERWEREACELLIDQETGGGEPPSGEARGVLEQRKNAEAPPPANHNALRHSELVRADLEKERDSYEARALRAEEAVWALLTPDQLRAGGFNDVADAVEKARRG